MVSERPFSLVLSLFCTTFLLLKQYRYGKTSRRKHKRIHWGTVDENNKFHPNKTFLYADLSERRKLIFPDDLDMSEVAALTSERKAGRPTNVDDDSNKLYGDIWLLEQIAPYGLVPLKGSQDERR